MIASGALNSTSGSPTKVGVNAVTSGVFSTPVTKTYCGVRRIFTTKGLKATTPVSGAF